MCTCKRMLSKHTNNVTSLVFGVPLYSLRYCGLQNGCHVVKTSKWCCNSWKKPSQRNPWFENLLHLEQTLLPLSKCCINVIWSQKTTDTHTSEYCNPSMYTRQTLTSIGSSNVLTNYTLQHKVGQSEFSVFCHRPHAFSEFLKVFWISYYHTVDIQWHPAPHTVWGESNATQMYRTVQKLVPEWYWYALVPGVQHWDYHCISNRNTSGTAISVYGRSTYCSTVRTYMQRFRQQH